MNSSDADTDIEFAAERPSKSQRKREMIALHDLADKLSTLSDAELSRLGLSEGAVEAVATIRPMRASGARQRQLKFVAKILLAEDISDSELLFADREAVQHEANKRFHALEQWRDRLIEQGDRALSALLEEHPSLDRQQFRQLIRAAQRERETEKPPTNARKLYKLLRKELENR